MSSLQLLLQSLQFAQGSRIDESIELIREAQREQQREDAAHENTVRSNPNAQSLDESITSFANAYLPDAAARSVIGSNGGSTGSTYRNTLIERWRGEI